ncbi:hypothetical protein KIN20_035511 [Parelaphostrongylus tenuis]|uniref:C2H2-type domain-containing protein n=1 Tax=Parelaphostrongylus tenuis TaxID=148309 RepID=A0AAD5RBM0_PARTN|nr:hypothetical protein KIN20_035511 [Parelaphostrongylus tenuis]
MSSTVPYSNIKLEAEVKEDERCNEENEGVDIGENSVMFDREKVKWEATDETERGSSEDLIEFNDDIKQEKIMEVEEAGPAKKLMKIEEEVELDVTEETEEVLDIYRMFEMEMKWEPVEDLENASTSENSVASNEDVEREEREVVLETNGTEKLYDCKKEEEWESTKDFEYASTSEQPLLEYGEQEEFEELEETDNTEESYEKEVEWESIEDVKRANACGYLVPEVEQEEDEYDENTEDRENLFEELMKQEEVETIEDGDATEETTMDYEEDAEDPACIHGSEEEKKICKKLREKRRDNEKHVGMLEERIEKKRKRELQRPVATRKKKIHLLRCFMCSRVFAKEETMRQHVSEKHAGSEEEYIFKCSKCERRFKNLQHFCRHELSHDSAFTCFYCKMEFRKEISLRVHLSKAHYRSLDGSRLPKTFECKCGRKFGLHVEFLRHLNHRENKEIMDDLEKVPREQRRRCQCYKNLLAKKGAYYARDHAKKTCTRCARCKVHFCSECYEPAHLCSPKDVT